MNSQFFVMLFLKKSDSSRYPLPRKVELKRMIHIENCRVYKFATTMKRLKEFQIRQLPTCHVLPTFHLATSGFSAGAWKAQTLMVQIMIEHSYWTCSTILIQAHSSQCTMNGSRDLNQMIAMKGEHYFRYPTDIKLYSTDSTGAFSPPLE
jgi:hypothetical protein